MGMTAVWLDASGTRLNLNGGYLRLQTLQGAGIGDLVQRVVRTPTRDGETYIESLLEPRFLLLELVVIELCSYQDLEDLQRRLSAAFNPKNGLGTLRWTPAEITYEIPAVLERGLDFRTPSQDHRLTRILLNLRCPDPAWRLPTANTQTIAIPVGAGLSVPITVPISFGASAATATITNAGDLDSPPTITVAGPVTNPRITNNTTGKLVQFNLTLIAGQELVIDMDARTAVINPGGNNAMPDRSPDSESWPLIPGDNSITCLTSADGSDFDFSWFTRYVGV